MNWDEYKKEFEPDGSLRDLLISNTDVSNWQRLIDFLQRDKYHITYKENNRTVLMPRDIRDIFQKRNEMPILMSVEVNGIIINSHFFTAQEIEFDIDPQEINNEEKLDQLFEFMREIGWLLQKEVALTPESYEAETIFRYVPETDKIEYNPPRQ